VQPPEEQLAGVATWYASTCRQCPAGCGIVARIMNGRALKLEGNRDHPLNQGKLCARGQADLQTLYDPDRLTGPVQQSQRGSRQYQPVAWEAVTNELYRKLSEAGDRVAVWVDSTVYGHLLDIFQRFNTAVGAPAPLVYDMYTGLSGYRVLSDVNQTLFGQGTLPSYHLSHADVVLSFGANFLGTWLSSVRYGVEFGGFRGQPLGKRGFLAQLEPRMSINGTVADQWLPIRADTQAVVARALVKIIAEEGFGPPERVELAKSLADEVDVGQVAAASELTAETLEQLARVFAEGNRPLAIPGEVLTGLEDATGAVAAVQALNVIASTAEEPGGMELSPPPPSDAVVVPTPAAYSDVQALIDRMRAGEIEVLMVHGANPAYDLPEGAGFLDALAQVPFVVSFASSVDETAVWADMILPDRAHLESWGYASVSPSFGQPVVSSQQPVVTPVFDSRSTADIVLTVSRGIPAAARALPWADEVAFLRDVVTQLGPGASGGLDTEDVLWASFLQHGGWWPASSPDEQRPLPQPESLATTAQWLASQNEAPPEPAEGEYPFFLHIYVSDLLSDGRGASQPWLQGSPDPMISVSWQTWVEINPETAEEQGIADGDVVRVTSPHGEVEAIAYRYPAIRPDTVAIPTGQGHTDLGRYARGRGSNPMKLVGTETGTTGANLTWADVRVKITPTGEKKALARFESTLAVETGHLSLGHGE
jgi:anaerobic selenocysteine-containing dehydrogenase